MLKNKYNHCVNRDFEGLVFRVIEKGWWGHKASTMYYKVVAFRTAKIEYNFINTYDWLLVRIGYHTYRRGYIGDEFSTKIWKANIINEYLNDIMSGKEIETLYGWVSLIKSNELKKLKKINKEE